MPAKIQLCESGKTPSVSIWVLNYDTDKKGVGMQVHYTEEDALKASYELLDLSYEENSPETYDEVLDEARHSWLWHHEIEEIVVAIDQSSLIQLAQSLKANCAESSVSA